MWHLKLSIGKSVAIHRYNLITEINNICSKKRFYEAALGKIYMKNHLPIKFVSSTSTDKPETLTVTVKTKWLWLVLGIALSLLAIAPVVYSALPSTAQGGSGTSSGGAAPPPSSAAAANCGNPCTIVIANSLFGTVQPIIVTQGTTVIWQNKDNTQHTTTSDSPGVWDSGILSPGQSFSVKFNSTGTFTYHCNIHPMTGTIQVIS